MRLRCTILILALFSLIACQRGVPARAPWTSAEANQALLGGGAGGPGGTYSTSTTSNDALLAVYNVRCGESDEEGYLVDVGWVTTMDDITGAVLEYEVLQVGTVGGLAGMNNPIVAEIIDYNAKVGSSTVVVARHEIREAGDRILVRIVFGTSRGVDVAAPVDEYKVDKLCTEADEVPSIATNDEG